MSIDLDISFSVQVFQDLENEEYGRKCHVRFGEVIQGFDMFQAWETKISHTQVHASFGAADYHTIFELAH